MASIYFSILIEALDHISFILFFESDPGLVGHSATTHQGKERSPCNLHGFFHIRLAIQPFSSSNPATKFCVVVSFFGLRLSVLLWPLRLHICGLSKQKGVLRELYYVRELSMLSQCSIIPLLCLSDETAEVYCLYLLVYYNSTSSIPFVLYLMVLHWCCCLRLTMYYQSRYY